MKKWTAVVPVAIALLMVSTTAYAADEAVVSYSAIGAGLTMGIAVLGGALGQGMAARGMYESVARNPQAAGKLNAPFYVGMAFIESLVIFAMLVAFSV
jgi:F-type H+-transporting ATPase subunit c